MTTKLLDRPKQIDRAEFDAKMARLIAEWEATLQAERSRA